MAGISDIIRLLNAGGKRKVVATFRAIAGMDLYKCGKSPNSGILEEAGIDLVGESGDFTDRVLLDSIVLCITVDGGSASFCTYNGLNLAGARGIQATKVEYEDCLKELSGKIQNKMGGSAPSESASSSEGNSSDGYDDDFPDEDFPDRDDPEDAGWDPQSQESNESNDTGREPENQDIDPIPDDGSSEDNSKEVGNADRNKDMNDPAKVAAVKRYYGGRIDGVMSKLEKCYTAMFESGYGVQGFAGIATMDGMIKLSGGSTRYNIEGEAWTGYDRSDAVDSLCRMLLTRLDVIEAPFRSKNNMVNRILGQYMEDGGKKLIYTHLSMPLTALDELRKAAAERNDDRYIALADIVDAHQGLWCPEAEEYLLANFITE